MARKQGCAGRCKQPCGQRGLVVIVLMGVSGAGKTVVGKLLASRLNCQFADGDDYHSAANVEKMSHHIPLTDADRAPWLATLRALFAGWIAEQKNAVLACSALKQSYRETLRVSPQVRFVYLKGSAHLLRQRLHAREGHFMTEGMLASQLETLEEPTDALAVDVSAPPAAIVAEILQGLALAPIEGKPA